MPWGIVLLIGGGFAVADAFDATGLSTWVGERFQTAFHDAGTLELVIGLCLLITFLTEFATNVVLVNTTLPVLAAAAVSLGIDPRLLLVPATVCASYGFMLPISTPPNAIVFSTRRISMRDMVGVGFVLNLIGVVLMVVVTFTLLIPVMGLTVGGGISDER
jgi:sodium-dependent dicarboxylate transporter 2/3/5